LRELAIDDNQVETGDVKHHGAADLSPSKSPRKDLVPVFDSKKAEKKERIKEKQAKRKF
jgi:hypothetical protein